MIKSLFPNNANTSLGETPLDIAKQANNIEAIKLIHSYTQNYFPTKADGSCIFHAAFGTEKNGIFAVDDPNLYRTEWAKLLMKFSGLSDPSIPKALLDLLEIIFNMFLEKPSICAIDDSENEIVRAIRIEVKEKLRILQETTHKLTQEIIDLLNSKPLDDVGKQVIHLFVKRMIQRFETTDIYNSIKKTILGNLKNDKQLTDTEINWLILFLNDHKIIWKIKSRRILIFM